jgi:hypothetical protein
VQQIDAGAGIAELQASEGEVGVDDAALDGVTGAGESSDAAGEMVVGLVGVAAL